MGYKTYTCPIARECGGCEWLAVPYPIQLRRKQGQVVELLGDMAERDDATMEPMRGMREPVRYRHKAATPFAHARGGRVRCGFYAAGTHRIVPCEECLVEDPRARRILNAVARTAERLHIPPYDEDRGTGVLRHAVVRCGWKTDDVLLVLVARVAELRDERRVVDELRSACPELTSIVLNVNDRRTNAILGRRSRTLHGPGVMHDELLGCRFEIGPTSFYQTNPAQTETLYELAIEGVDGAASVLDAYCGTGTIGICAAARSEGLRVTGVEQVGGAVASAERNARANHVADRCRFVAADATAWMARGSRPASRHRDHGPAPSGQHARVPGRRGGARARAHRLRELQRRHAGPRPRAAARPRLPPGARRPRGHVPAHQARGVRRHARAPLAAATPGGRSARVAILARETGHPNANVEL